MVPISQKLEMQIFSLKQQKQKQIIINQFALQVSRNITHLWSGNNSLINKKTQLLYVYLWVEKYFSLKKNVYKGQFG